MVSIWSLSKLYPNCTYISIKKEFKLSQCLCYRWDFNNTQNYTAALFKVTPKQTEKSKLYAAIAHVKYINISAQMKATKTKAQDRYSVWNRNF